MILLKQIVERPFLPAWTAWEIWFYKILNEIEENDFEKTRYEYSHFGRFEKERLSV